MKLLSLAFATALVAASLVEARPIDTVEQWVNEAEADEVLHIRAISRSSAIPEPPQPSSTPPPTWIPTTSSGSQPSNTPTPPTWVPTT
ncbi:hypothetical protein BGZ95_005636, partial [Linnemannia exigua]